MAKSKYQKFEMREMLRSQIIPHPKNPRVITDNAKKKIKDKIESDGLLQPIIVNSVTGYLLGGHQRLDALDRLERYKPGKNDYSLDVAVVKLNEKEELELIVFLNNTSAQGSWNTELLAEMNLELGMDFASAGFDSMDINLMFDVDSRFQEIFPDTQEVKETKASLDEIKAVRKENTQHMKEKQSAEFYCLIVCKDDKEKKELLRRMNIADYETYISSEAVFAALK